MRRNQKYTIEKFQKPFQQFIQNEKRGGIVLGICVLIALLLANTPLSIFYHHFLEQQFGLPWNGTSYFSMSVHH